MTGATGFIGARLAPALAAGWTVRCLVRDRSRAGDLERRGFEIHEGDVLGPETLQGAGRDVGVAYYLIHAMGRGARGDFVARKLPVPLLTPRLSSLWIGLVTPVDAGVARPLIEGLSTKTVVTDTSGAMLFDVAPLPFEEALRRAVADDAAAASVAAPRPAAPRTAAPQAVRPGPRPAP